MFNYAMIYPCMSKRHAWTCNNLSVPLKLKTLLQLDLLAGGY